MNQPEVKLRTPWQVMHSVLTALIIREIQRRFITSVNTNRSIGFLWVFIEPMLHVAAWVAIKEFYGVSSSGSLPTTIFILLGAIPFLLFRVVPKSTLVITQNKGLFVFRQIKPPDFVLSLVLSEVLVMCLVYLILLSGLYWFGVNWTLHRPLVFISALAAYTVMLLGLSLSFSVAGFFFRFINNAWMILMRILYMTSGVFFSADSVPASVRELLLYNPLFQVIEISRESFSQVSPQFQYGDISYLWEVALGSLFFGLLVYVSLKYKIMTEIEQR